MGITGTEWFAKRTSSQALVFCHGVQQPASRVFHQLRSAPNAPNKSPAPQLLLLRCSHQVFSATERAVRYSPTTAAYLGHQAHPVQDEHRLLRKRERERREKREER